MIPLGQHQREMQANLSAWNAKPLLRQIYAGFYRRMLGLVDGRIPGRIVEIGSGIGNLKTHLPQAISTDLFVNPWLDLVWHRHEPLSGTVLFRIHCAMSSIISPRPTPSCGRRAAC